jgi:hypothetical protein
MSSANDVPPPTQPAAVRATAEVATLPAGAALPGSPRRPRTWPAILTLYVLAPIVGEVFSWSTPPLKLLLDPGTFVFEPAFYGSGAILIREVVRRQGLGWPSILTLGAAYGVVEEAITVQSWFIPPGVLGVDGFGRSWEISWIWALGLTVFHAVFSISVPIVLTESLFPAVAARPWLGRRLWRFFIFWLAFVALLGAVGNGFLLYRKQGYFHPPLAQFALAVALAIGIVWLGLRPSAQSTAQPARARPAPGLWALRVFGFVATLAFFFAFYGLPAFVCFAPVVAASMAGVVALAAWRIRAWSRRSGLGAPQRLALASGALGFWIAASPARFPTGLPIVALAFVALLILLARQASRSLVLAAAPSPAG